MFNLGIYAVVSLAIFCMTFAAITITVLVRTGSLKDLRYVAMVVRAARRPRRRSIAKK